MSNFWGKAPTAENEILDHQNQLYLSSVSLWEMQIKAALGRLKLAVSLRETWAETSKANSIELLKIENSHIWQIDKIGDFHKDTFDRMLIAQCQQEGFCLVTKDRDIKRYKVETIW